MAYRFQKGRELEMGEWKAFAIDKWQKDQPSDDENVAVISKNYPLGSKGLFNDLPN